MIAAAFVLATFGFASFVRFAFDHIVTLSSVGLVGLVVASVLLAIFVPPALPLIRAALDVVLKGLTWLITTTAGAFVIVAVLFFLGGFWTHSFLDKSIELQKQLEAQRAATAAAQTAAAQARLQAAALNAVNDAAARRAETAEADASDYAEQAADLEDQLEAEKRAATPAKPARTYPLTAADVAAFLRIGAPRAAKP